MTDASKNPTSPTPNIETAHLELEVVILDEVLNQLARHLDDGRPDDGRPPPLALGGPGGVVCSIYIVPHTVYCVHCRVVTQSQIQLGTDSEKKFLLFWLDNPLN